MNRKHQFLFALGIMVLAFLLGLALAKVSAVDVQRTEPIETYQDTVDGESLQGGSPYLQGSSPYLQGEQ